MANTGKKKKGTRPQVTCERCGELTRADQLQHHVRMAHDATHFFACRCGHRFAHVPELEFCQKNKVKSLLYVQVTRHA